jgi:hypothetical protein
MKTKVLLRACLNWHFIANLMFFHTNYVSTLGFAFDICCLKYFLLEFWMISLLISFRSLLSCHLINEASLLVTFNKILITSLNTVSRGHYFSSLSEFFIRALIRCWHITYLFLLVSRSWNQNACFEIWLCRFQWLWTSFLISLILV